MLRKIHLPQEGGSLSLNINIHYILYIIYYTISDFILQHFYHKKLAEIVGKGEKNARAAVALVFLPAK